MISFKKKPKTEIFYTNCDIPAKLFFYVMHNQDYQKLGTASLEECEAAYDKIFDEYNEILPNPKLMRFVKRKNKIELLQAQKHAIESILYIIACTTIEQSRRERYIDQLNSIQGVKINFKKDVRLIFDEIERVQNQVIGMLENEINSEKKTDKEKKEKAKYVFERDLVHLRFSLDGMQIDDNLSLYTFAELTKIGQELNNQRSKQHGTK